MAIYHFSAKTISRSGGRSAVAAASYRSGEMIADARTGLVHDFRTKGGVESKVIFLPGGGTMPRSELWNKVEAAHKRGDAVTAREIEVAVPCELSLSERARLISDYGRQLSDRYRVAVDGAGHAPNGDQRNFHVHFLMSACYVSPLGVMGKKCVELDPIHCQRAKIANSVEEQRVIWQDMCNAALEKAGHSARIDHRTLVAQGITDRPAGVHLGPAVSEIIKDCRQSDVSDRIAGEVAIFMGEVQADAAIAAAQESAGRELIEAEAALIEAQQTLETVRRQPAPVPVAEAARPRTKKELQAELGPMIADLRKAQEVIDEGNRRRAGAKPIAQVEAAKKAVPSLAKRNSQAQTRAQAMAQELESLPWWRPFRKIELKKALPEAQRSAAKLADELPKVQALARATRLETLERVVKENKAIQAKLAPLCWPLERQIAAIEAQEAAVRAAEDARQAQARAQAQEVAAAAQMAEYESFVAEARARPKPKTQTQAPERDRSRSRGPRG